MISFFVAGKVLAIVWQSSRGAEGDAAFCFPETASSLSFLAVTYSCQRIMIKCQETIKNCRKERKYNEPGIQYIL